MGGDLDDDDFGFSNIGKKYNIKKSGNGSNLKKHLK